MTSWVAPMGDPDYGAVHLRLVWPQWQGAGSPSVAATVAEFIPRQVMHLQQVVDGFPLIG